MSSWFPMVSDSLSDSVQVGVYSADKEGATGYVAQCGRDEVGSDRLHDGYIGSFKHSEGYEEHVGYTVLVAECYESHHRKPASESLLYQ